VSEDRLAVQGAQQDVGDHLRVGARALGGDERADVAMPEAVDRVVIMLRAGGACSHMFGFSGAGTPETQTYVREARSPHIRDDSLLLGGGRLQGRRAVAERLGQVSRIFMVR
jgi:hypothetical protein